MPSLSLVIPLSSSVRNAVQRLCHGLAHVEWTDEFDLFVLLQQIETKNQGVVVDIRECLANIELPPFSINLQGMEVHQGKKGRGAFCLGVLNNPELASLCKEMDRNLKPLALAQIKSIPHIILGRFHSLSTERVATYLETHSLFSLSMTVSSFALMDSHATPKRIVYTCLQNFSLTEL